MKWKRKHISAAGFCALCLLWFMMLPANCLLQTVNFNLSQEIGKLIKHESAIDFAIVPGLVVGIWFQGETQIESFGHQVDAQSVFELGSLSKPITAQLVYGALDSLGLSHQTSIAHFFSDSMLQEEWKQVSIQQLIEHNAGLPRQSENMGIIERTVHDPYSQYDIARLEMDMQEINPSPGRYSYSHLGYAALHWLFEQVGGYPSFFQNKFHNKMSREEFGLVSDESVVAGHGFDGKPVPLWHPNALLPAMGLRSNMPDYLKWIQSIHPTTVLKNFKLTRGQRRAIHQLSRAGMYKVYQGWFMIPSGKVIVLYHNGHTGGHHVSAVYSPAEEIAVVVFANGKAGTNDLTLSILTMLRRAGKKQMHE